MVKCDLKVYDNCTAVAFVNGVDAYCYHGVMEIDEMDHSVEICMNVDVDVLQYGWSGHIDIELEGRFFDKDMLKYSQCKTKHTIKNVFCVQRKLRYKRDSCMVWTYTFEKR